MTLEELGWDNFFEKAFAPYASKNLIPARLCFETKINFSAIIEGGELLEAVVGGKLWYDTSTDAELPGVGDWVALERNDQGDENIIRARLPRKTFFSRKKTGKSAEEQLIASNLNYVLIVTDPGGDYNLRRLERYLTLVEKGGAKAIIILNKSDLFAEKEIEVLLSDIKSLRSDIACYAISAKEGEGCEQLNPYLSLGHTLTLVGSSGVGKTTLLNYLCGSELRETFQVNGTTGKGRHTTTARELLPLPSGALLIDNPGMREVQMWTDEETLRASFSDIEDLALMCKYSDCYHQNDVGCALKSAVEMGELSVERYESYLGLEEEVANLVARQKKRQIATERWAKRQRKVKARNLTDRIDLEKEERGEL